MTTDERPQSVITSAPELQSLIARLAREACSDLGLVRNENERSLVNTSVVGHGDMGRASAFDVLKDA